MNIDQAENIRPHSLSSLFSYLPMLPSKHTQKGSKGGDSADGRSLLSSSSFWGVEHWPRSLSLSLSLSLSFLIPAHVAEQTHTERQRKRKEDIRPLSLSSLSSLSSHLPMLPRPAEEDPLEPRESTVSTHCGGHGRVHSPPPRRRLREVGRQSRQHQTAVASSELHQLHHLF